MQGRGNVNFIIYKVGEMSLILLYASLGNVVFFTICKAGEMQFTLLYVRPEKCLLYCMQDQENVVNFTVCKASNRDDILLTMFVY